MKFERRVYIGLLLIVAAFLPVALTAFLAIREVANEQDLLVSKDAQSVLLAERLRYMNSVESALMPIFVLTGNPEIVKSFYERNKQFQEIAEQLLEIETDPATRDHIETIKVTANSLKSFVEPGIALKKSGASIQETNDYFYSQAGPVSVKLKSELDQLINLEAKDLEVAKARVLNTVRRVIDVLEILLIAALALVVVVWRLIVKMMAQKRATDLAQMRLMIQERKISQARKETVEVVSHDLKNPLGTVQMSLELIMDQIKESDANEELKPGLQIAYRATQSMDKLIKDLLDHAKIEAGNLILEKKSSDVAVIISELTNRFSLQAAKKNINLNSSVKGNDFVAVCDAGRIEQVLSNLIGNSIKFTPSNGQIKIELRLDEDSILVSVEDSGPGMSADQLPHIFERFWQVKETASKGTGLGLSIAKAVIEAHNGKIWADSAPGKGSKFYFTIPKQTRIAAESPQADLG